MGSDGDFVPSYNGKSPERFVSGFLQAFFTQDSVNYESHRILTWHILSDVPLRESSGCTGWCADRAEAVGRPGASQLTRHHGERAGACKRSTAVGFDSHRG
eukprot:380725-Prorocentrum_minimum.AAC.4